MNRWPEDQEGLRAALRRAAVVKVDDTGKQQLVDLTALAGEQLKQVVRILPHGFNSNPPAKSQGVLICLGGRSDRAMILGLEDPETRQRNLPSGTAILYDDKGNIIFMKGNAGIVIDAKVGDLALTIEQGAINISAKNAVTITSTTSTFAIVAHGDITIDPGTDSNGNPHNIYLGGGSVQQQALLLTVAGSSTNVFARVG